jgi:hypothetical protein
MSPLLALGALVDDPAALAEPRPPLMKRMCCRCELVLGWKVCEPANAGAVTHGLCEGCALALTEELDGLPSPESAIDLPRWRENRAALAQAVEYTLEIGGAGPAPQAATPFVARGPVPHHGAVNANAGAGDGEVLVRPGLLSFSNPELSP